MLTTPNAFWGEIDTSGIGLNVYLAYTSVLYSTLERPKSQWRALPRSRRYPLLAKFTASEMREHGDQHEEFEARKTLVNNKVWERDYLLVISRLTKNKR